MLNPYLWLFFIGMLALSAFTGYRQGVKVTKFEYEEAARQAMTAMVDRHNELVAEDIKAAVTAETRRQNIRLVQQEKRHAFELEAARNHRPECAWSDNERGMLNDLIDGANGTPPAAPGLSDGLRPPAEVGRKRRSDRESLGGWHNWRLWRMSL